MSLVQCYTDLKFISVKKLGKTKEWNCKIDSHQHSIRHKSASTHRAMQSVNPVDVLFTINFAKFLFVCPGEDLLVQGLCLLVLALLQVS